MFLPAPSFFFFFATLALTACGGTSELLDAGVDGNIHTTPDGLLQPGDITYLGAFRLPDPAPGAPDAESFSYGGGALAFRPDGDRGGTDDGHPGSLFGAGHDVTHFVSEIAIPAPSLSRTVSELPMATTLQGFADVRHPSFTAFEEIPKVGLEWMPAMGEQASARLYMTWGQHFHEDSPVQIPTHAWCGTDLSAPSTQGTWWIGAQSLYSVNDYLFRIPQGWADQHTGGMSLATGRVRDGGWSGMGPALFAIAPWQAGDPPAPGTRLPVRPLLLYSNTQDDPGGPRMNGYQQTDEWEGGAFLTTKTRTAVAFVGAKGFGYHWYGFYSPGDGGQPCVADYITDFETCYDPQGNPCPAELKGFCEGHSEESRGWWSSRWDAQILLYDPADLAAVAAGQMEPHEPQPYASLDIDEHLFLAATVEREQLGAGDQRRYRLGATAYDRERGFLYIVERHVEEAKPVIHVFRVQ